MLYNVKEDKLYIGDAELDYITFGTGAKPLVMIQGLNTRGIKGAGLPLAYTYRLFAKDYTVYLFDRRPDVWDSITVRDMAKDIASAMDTLHISNADVLGVSQGGMIGQYLAIGRPDLVHTMVLAATLCRNNETVFSVIDNWIALTQEHNMKALVHDMTVKLYSENYIRRYKPFLPLLTLLQKPKDPVRFITLAKSCLTCDTYELLSQIQCPVLVIGGAQDKIVGSASAKELADKLGCELILYQHFGHAVYEEAKDFNQKVYDFFKQHV